MSRAEQCLVSHTLRFLNRSPQIGGSTHLLATFTFTLLLRSQTYPTSVGPEDKAGAELLDSWYDTPVDLSKDEELNAASYLVEEGEEEIANERRVGSDSSRVVLGISSIRGHQATAARVFHRAATHPPPACYCHQQRF